ncbi:MAG: alanine racemase [Proteobacteria bacterium]|nr:alanine racemase [Pseudomonadota bacterium]
MTATTLSIDLNAIVANWRALDALSAATVETSAVVKADGYGLGAGPVAAALAKAGARSFFVALAEEGVAVRKAVGNAPAIYVFSGLVQNDALLMRDYNLIPLLNSAKQLVKLRMQAPDLAYGVQIDTGMSRLGMELSEFIMVRDKIAKADLIISHLACADEPDHAQNAQQLHNFNAMTRGVSIRRSLSATGGILLGADYHFDLVRPGIGLYGAAPFKDATPVINISIPVIQTRKIAAGQTVGYAALWTAKRPSKIATLAAGYADGLIRAMGDGGLMVWAGNTPCPIVGRVSMDLITVDITDLDRVPDHMEIINAHQGVDHVAKAAGTIGYEILTSLGARYKRDYRGG